jgi:Ca2+-binding RTX toxin-like protein
LNPGTLAAGSFRAGAGVSAAADADDFVIYDSSSGALYYDANGHTGAGPVQNTGRSPIRQGTMPLAAGTVHDG